eukprot:GEMP01023176.1.p1 GENE.GEMP01023176.1~~GEMP01023176.1.p1  ORF type:complete len:554 (+),score=135.48 GEMP01023176.1:154-1815(+)
MFPRYAGLRKPQVKLVDWDTLEVDGVTHARGDTSNAAHVTKTATPHDFMSPDAPHFLFALMKWKQPTFIDDSSAITQYRRLLPKEGYRSAPQLFIATTTTCPICCDADVDCVLSCGHGACRACWERYVCDHGSDAFVCCMSCPHVIDTIAYSYLAPKTWLHKVRRDAVNDLKPGTTACHRCGLMFTSVAPIVVCEQCGAQTCGDCEERCHWPLPCGGKVQETVKCADAFLGDTKSFAAKSSNQVNSLVSVTKQCPNCGRHWEKNGGCTSMRCTNCKTTWQWNEQPETTWLASDLNAHVTKHRLSSDAIKSMATKIIAIREQCIKSARAARKRLNDPAVQKASTKEVLGLWCLRTKEIFNLLPMLLRFFVAEGAPLHGSRLRQLRKDVRFHMFRLDGSVGIDATTVDKQAVAVLEDVMTVIYRRVAHDKVAGLVNVQSDRFLENAVERRSVPSASTASSSSYSPLEKQNSKSAKRQEREYEDPEWFGENLATLLDEGVEFDAAWNALTVCKGDLELARSMCCDDSPACSDNVPNDFDFSCKTCSDFPPDVEVAA